MALSWKSNALIFGKADPGVSMARQQRLNHSTARSKRGMEC